MLKVFILALLTSVAVANKVKLVGHTDCGSQGALEEVILSNCHEVPCHFTPKEQIDLEIIFEASAASASPILRTSAIAFGQEHPIRETKIEGHIEPGMRYLFRHSFNIGDFFAGLRTTIKFEILREGHEGALEICLQAAMNVSE